MRRHASLCTGSEWRVRLFFACKAGRGNRSRRVLVEGARAVNRSRREDLLLVDGSLRT